MSTLFGIALPDFSLSTDDEEEAWGAGSMAVTETAMYDFGTRDQHTLEPTFADSVGAGVDMGKALLFRGAQSIAEASGMFDRETVEHIARLKEEALFDQSQAMQGIQHNGDFTDEQGNIDWGNIGLGVGQGIGTLAVAAPAAVMGLFGGKAALASGFAASAMMNIGDIGLKSEQEFESVGREYVAGLSDVAMGSALGVPEMLIGGRFLKSFDNVAAAATNGMMTRMGMNVAENAVSGAISEGAQDFATSYIAGSNAGTWTPEMMQEKFAEAGQEALIGGIITAPLGVGSTVAENLANSEFNKFNKMFQAEDDQGNLLFEADGVTPVYDFEKTNWEDYRTEPGMWNKAYSMVLGGPTAKIMASHVGQSQLVAELVAEFSQTTGDWGRARGIETVGSVANKNKGIMYQQANPFLSLNKKDRQAVAEAIWNKDTTAIQDNKKQMKAYEGLRNLWDANGGVVVTRMNEINQKLADGGRATMEDFHALGDDYFTNAGDVDVKKIKQDKEGFKAAALAAAEETGVSLSEQQVDAYMQLLDQNGYVHYGRQDNILHTIKQRQETLMANEGMTAEEAMREASNLSTIRSTKTSRTNKNNPLEVERMLNQLPQAFWADWRRGDLAEAVKGYIDMTSERLAHVEKFGVNNEIYTERVVEAMLDAQQQTFQGQPVVIKSSDWQNWANLINASQRIPSNRIQSEYKFMPLKALGIDKGFTLREAQNAIRSLLNMTLLPLSLLPSIPEVVVVAEKTGQNVLTTTGKVLFHTVKNGWGHRRTNPDVEGMIGHLGFGLHEALNTAGARYSDGAMNLTRAEGVFFNYTGTPRFTEGLRMTAATAAERMVISDIKKYADPTTGQLEKQRLAQKMLEIGLNPNTMQNMYQASTVDGTFSYEQVQQHPDFGQFVTAVHNFVEDTVVHPHPVQKPSWMNDERLQLLAQLKTYAVVFTNQVMRSWWHRMSGQGIPTNRLNSMANLAVTVSTMVAMQSFLSAGRELVKTGELDNWDDQDFMDHVLNGTAYIGGLSFAVDPFRSSSFGVDPSTVLLGPGVSTGNEAIQGLTGVMASILEGDIPADDVALGIIDQASRNYPLVEMIAKEL